MVKFSNSEIQEMKRQLALNGYHSLMRLIVLHDKNTKTIVQARREFGIFCSASGQTLKSWEQFGLRGVFILRALEYAECFGIKIFVHQLQPTTTIAIHWLEYEWLHKKDV
ncbi:TPA: hypothetical protein ACX6QL_002032 [Photobacterium damselae]